MSVASGSRLDGDLAGLASFTAGMLDEGAGGLDASGIAAEMAFLGASLSTGASWDGMAVTLRAPKRTMEPSLDLMAEVARRPTFAAQEVGRQRDLRITQQIQAKDQPGAVASLTFHRVIFPATHPYHRSANGDSASTARLDSATVRRFYDRTFRPDRVGFVVTGDISLAEAQRFISERFGDWQAPADPAPTPPSVTNPAPKPTGIYLVDKPGAAQSIIAIGTPGPERSDPDYFAIEVMNTLLGGSFTSRLNSNLRERKGYSYGAGSGYAYRPLAGPFIAQSAVRSNVTDSSLVEFFNEFHRIRDEVVESAELERAKSYLALGLAGDFETTGQVASQLNGLRTFGLPFNWYDSYVGGVMAVTAADVQRVAQRLIRPDQFSVIVVGDVATIKAGIEALALGPVTVLPTP
jgi:zinc protease